MDFDEEEDGLEGLDEVAGLREVGALDLPFVGGLGAIGMSLMGYDRSQILLKNDRQVRFGGTNAQVEHIVKSGTQG